MRNLIKFATAAVFACVGLATTASANDVKIGYGANVTIIVCGTCTTSPARQAATPTKKEQLKPVISAKQRYTKASAGKTPTKAKPVATVSGSAQDIRCLSNGAAYQLKVRWERPVNAGRCKGFVRASDFAKVAQLAAKGYDKFMIRFEVEHCPSGLAKMPAEVKNGVLTNRPWDKTCLPEGQEYATRAR